MKICKFLESGIDLDGSHSKIPANVMGPQIDTVIQLDSVAELS